jgi:putative metalloprotease
VKIPLLLFLSILLSGLRAVYADTPLTAKVDKRVESLVRVSVIRYLLNHGDTTAATRQVKQDIAQGFLWMSKLSRLLTTYEKQRNAYPTMESFMPRIVEFFNNTADQIDRWPRFVSIEEFENGDNQVDPDLKTLTIRFDRPMSGGYGFGYGPLGQEHFPLKKVNGYPNDRTITIDTALKPNFEYQINLLSIGFFSTEGWPIKNTLIRFKTGSGK